MTILNSKNNNSRLVPVTQTMTERLESYIRVFHTTSNNDAFVFPGKNRNRMDQSTAYNHFRDYLLMADIPHTGVGPRIHDFRHGVAVENLRRWSVSGKDLSNLLPYLSAFMGHVDFRVTQYYLRLTAEIYPDLVALVEKHCGDIIPELEGFYYEEG